MVKEHPKEGQLGLQPKIQSYSNALQGGNVQIAKPNPEETKRVIAQKKENEVADEATLELTRAQLSKGKFVNFSKILALVRTCSLVQFFNMEYA